MCLTCALDAQVPDIEDITFRFKQVGDARRYLIATRRVRQYGGRRPNQRQKQHCLDRGPEYHKIKKKWETKLAQAVERLKKVKAKFKKKGKKDEEMLMDFLNMN